MQNKYNYYLRVMHWLVAAIVIAQLTAGFVMTALDPKLYPSKYTIYGYHKSVGILLLILVTIRLGIRLNTVIPEMPKLIDAPHRLFAKLVHMVLYLGLFGLALSGLMASMFNGYKVSFFSIPIASFVAENKELGKLLHQAHEILPYAMIAAIVLHIIGFVKHQYIDKVDLWSRIDLKK